MENNPNAKLLRIFIGESDKINGQPLYEAIVYRAREKKLSGATVLRGIMGYGAASIVHTTKLFELSADLPILIEISADEEKVRAFTEDVLELFKEAGSGGLITIEKIEVIRYHPGDGDS